MSPDHTCEYPRDERRLPLLVHVPHAGARFHDVDHEFIADERVQQMHRALVEAEAHWLFWPSVHYGATVFKNDVSRLVFDPDRLLPDEIEPMSRRGLGAVYRRDLHGMPLPSREDERVVRKLVEDHYRPYHHDLEELVDGMLRKFDRCWIIDAHTFPDIPRPYEKRTSRRPVVCLGFDDAHVPVDAVNWFIGNEGRIAGIAPRTGQPLLHLNEPRAGSYVPQALRFKDPRVKSLSIAVNSAAKLRTDIPWGAEGFLSASDMLDRFFCWLSGRIARITGKNRVDIYPAEAVIIARYNLYRYLVGNKYRVVRVYDGNHVRPCDHPDNEAGFDAELLPDCWVAEAVFWPDYSPLGASLTCHVDRWSGTVRWLGRMCFEALAPPSLGTPSSHLFPKWTTFDRVTSLEQITPP